MKTALYEKHKELGAKMVEFCGWEMPVSYEGTVVEHQSVREDVGVFDVSHMGRVLITGPEAEKFLDYVCTNQISGKKDGSATYTVWARDNGSSVDDAIIYRENSTHFFTVVNAGNRQKDLSHLQALAKDFDVSIQDRYNEDGILAVQGPKAKKLLGKLFPSVETLKFMRFESVDFLGEKVILSGTGYTGSPGYEIYAPNTVLPRLWDYLFKEGQDLNIKPIGLGARDTLRLEMGFALYGHELSDEISPIESVSAWTVKLSKPDFLGKSAMLQLKESGKARFELGSILLDAGVAREGCPVFFEDEEIGFVTSGNHSPSLGCGIAILICTRKLETDSEVEIQVRKRRIKARIAAMPFVQPPKEPK